MNEERPDNRDIVRRVTMDERARLQFNVAYMRRVTVGPHVEALAPPSTHHEALAERCATEMHRRGFLASPALAVQGLQDLVVPNDESPPPIWAAAAISQR